MTIQEKNDAIRAYCRSKLYCTTDTGYPCPLYKFKGACSGMNLGNDIIERNFKLVSAMPDYKGKRETDSVPKTNNVDHPSHYNQGGMECIDEMVLIFGKEATMNFCLCNAWKYRYRANAKNGQEDFEKANAYIKCYKSLKETGHAEF